MILLIHVNFVNISLVSYYTSYIFVSLPREFRTAEEGALLACGVRSGAWRGVSNCGEVCERSAVGTLQIQGLILAVSW